LLLRKDQVVVPSVVGSDVAAARAALQNEGFEVDAVQATATQKSGTVIGQNPEGGTKADEGSTVVLTVSSGPGQAQVPSVDGLSEAAARRKLLDTGFKVKTRKKSSDDVPEGDAIGTEPSAGSQVDRGGTVTLIVSTGKEQVEVPNVVGAKRDAAERTLQDAGFTVDINEQEDDTKPENTVLSQDPGAGEQLPKGTRVTIVVATAPEQVEVPDTVGDDENGAIEELSGAGFKVRRTVVEVTSEDDDGVVQKQDPAGGEKAEQGTTVTIFVGSFTPPPEPTPGTEGGAAPTP
jgi:serine/threonine-protein kinase